MYRPISFDMLDHSGGNVPFSIGFKCNKRYSMSVKLLHAEGSVPDTLVPKMYNVLSFDRRDQSEGRVPTSR